MNSTQRTILLLGASRGLGLGLAAQFLDRGWAVVATARGAAAALEALKASHPTAMRIETLDINDEEGVYALASKLAGTRFDIVFVNAGVMDDKRPIGQVETDEFMRLLVTNALSPMRVIETFAPLLGPDGVVAAMSSGLGSVETNTSGGYDVYRASKAALNTLMRSHAARHPTRPVLAVSPGWVRTDMGGAGAALDVETSVRGIAEVLIAHLGKAGSAFVTYHGRAMPW